MAIFEWKFRFRNSFRQNHEFLKHISLVNYIQCNSHDCDEKDYESVWNLRMPCSLWAKRMHLAALQSCTAVWESVMMHTAPVICTSSSISSSSSSSHLSFSLILSYHNIYQSEYTHPHNPHMMRPSWTAVKRSLLIHLWKAPAHSLTPIFLTLSSGATFQRCLI